MAYKCRICQSNEVDSPGEVCELCASEQDPYAGGASSSTDYYSQPSLSRKRKPIMQTEEEPAEYVPRRAGKRKLLVGSSDAMTQTDPYGNVIIDQNSSRSVVVHKAGETPIIDADLSTDTPDDAQNSVSGGSISSGITKNITTDEQKKSALLKWGRSLFKGTPFPIDNTITMFQVFPDYSSTAVNAQGNACDQVIVYGKINNGAISENNDVEVYGHRDSNNNIVAKMIKNKASGTIIRPTRVISCSVIWIITLLFVALAVAAVISLGVEGLIWAGIIILCLTNLPLVFKILGAVFGILFSIFKRAGR